MKEEVVIALYDKFEDARGALADLVQAGIPKEGIALLANSSTASHPSVLSNPAFAKTGEIDGEQSETTSHAGLGAEIGGGVGGVLGLLIGIGLITIPGIGPVVAAGWWAPLIAGLGGGAVVGGVIGVLTKHGVADADAKLYDEGLRRGGTLVSAHVSGDQIERAKQVFKARGAVDIEERAADWQADGWISFDADGRSANVA